MGELARDVNRVRSYPLLNQGVEVGGAIYDVKTGAITTIDC
jgi:carbonic anhydrase